MILLLAIALSTPIVTAPIPPYSFTENGQPRGVAVELVEALAKEAELDGKMSFMPWKRALKLAEEGGAGPALILPLNRSADREERFLWVVPLLSDDTVLVTYGDQKPEVKSFEQALGWRVGVLAGSPLEAELKEKGFKHVDAGVDEETNARKLHAGRIDVWLVARMVAPFVFERQGFDPKKLVYGVAMRTNDLHLGATKTLPEAEVSKWRKALEALKQRGDYQKIVDRYATSPSVK